MGKCIDTTTLENYKYLLKSEDLQHSLKAMHATTHCTLVLNEVVDYYLNNGFSVFLVLLDASKAFDLVQYIKLLDSLLNVVCVQ